MAKRANTKPRECAFCGDFKTPPFVYREMHGEDEGKVECIRCHDLHVQEMDGTNVCDDVKEEEAAHIRETEALLAIMPRPSLPLRTEPVSVTLPRSYWRVVTEALRLAQRHLDDFDNAQATVDRIGRSIDSQL